jgi:hydroxymethylbilane synthase
MKTDRRKIPPFYAFILFNFYASSRSFVSSRLRGCHRRSKAGQKRGCWMGNANRIIQLGARGSLLSRMQSAEVAAALEASWPGLKVQIVTVVTSGDRIQDRPLHEFGGKGLFTRELEQALLRGEVDLAVHSFKDVPVTMPLVATADLVIAAVPAREDVRDVLVSKIGGDARGIAALPKGARVGTGSLRRQAQLLAARPDLHAQAIRGNVDTRLRKLHDGECDAVVLAMAGLKRAKLWDESCMQAIPIEEMLPAAGQGALALECRREDAELRELLAKLNDPDSALCVKWERSVVETLHGDCHSPIGVYATVEEEKERGGGRMRIRAAVAGRDGRPPVIRAEAVAETTREADAAREVVEKLNAQGAGKLLAGG